MALPAPALAAAKNASALQNELNKLPQRLQPYGRIFYNEGEGTFQVAFEKESELQELKAPLSLEDRLSSFRCRWSADVVFAEGTERSLPAAPLSPLPAEQRHLSWRHH